MGSARSSLIGWAPSSPVTSVRSPTMCGSICTLHHAKKQTNQKKGTRYSSSVLLQPQCSQWNTTPGVPCAIPATGMWYIRFAPNIIADKTTKKGADTAAHSCCGLGEKTGTLRQPEVQQNHETEKKSYMPRRSSCPPPSPPPLPPPPASPPTSEAGEGGDGSGLSPDGGLLA